MRREGRISSKPTNRSKSSTSGNHWASCYRFKSTGTQKFKSTCFDSDYDVVSASAMLHCISGDYMDEDDERDLDENEVVYHYDDESDLYDSPRRWPSEVDDDDERVSSFDALLRDWRNGVVGIDSSRNGVDEDGVGWFDLLLCNWDNEVVGIDSSRNGVDADDDGVEEEEKKILLLSRWGFKKTEDCDAGMSEKGDSETGSLGFEQIVDSDEEEEKEVMGMCGIEKVKDSDDDDEDYDVCDDSDDEEEVILAPAVEKIEDVDEDEDDGMSFCDVGFAVEEIESV